MLRQDKLCYLNNCASEDTKHKAALAAEEDENERTDWGYECVNQLLKSGCDPNDTDKKGATPIKLAARHGLARIANALLYHGVRSGQHAITRYMRDGDRKEGRTDLRARRVFSSPHARAVRRVVATPHRGTTEAGGEARAPTRTTPAPRP